MEELLPYDLFEVKVDEANIERIPQILEAAAPRTPSMRAEMLCACHALHAPWSALFK